MKKLPIFQVDAFSAAPFSGNPAAVCLLSESLADDTMQKIAAEMNLSETAFVQAEGEGWRLRWFTPAAEVELCGHATLAAAHVLWERRLLARRALARFFTRSGELRARFRKGWIELDFPARGETPVPAPTGLLSALFVEPRHVGRFRDDYLVEAVDEQTVRGLHPDFALLKQTDARAVTVTARSADPAFDFVSRFFAPKMGVNEDPVTGSAHCLLGPYWGAKLGKNELTAFQASGRGGVVKIRLAGERLFLGGQAKTVLRGELCL